MWWLASCPISVCSSIPHSWPVVHRFGFIGPVELSTSAFLFANLGHIPSERWRERFLAEALKFRVRRLPGRCGSVLHACTCLALIGVCQYQSMGSVAAPAVQCRTAIPTSLDTPGLLRVVTRDMLVG